MHFLDVPNLGLWRTDFETGQSSWSGEMFNIYGLQPEIHSPSVDVLMKYVHRDDRDMVSDSIHRATKSLTPFSLFHRIVRKDRSVRSVYSMGRFEVQPNGKPTCRHGICLNLTGLSKADLTAIKGELAGIELPSLTLLLALDPADKNMAAILRLAAAINEKMRAKIAAGNSSVDAAT